MTDTKTFGCPQPIDIRTEEEPTMNRKHLWMIAGLGMALLALPAAGQSGYTYQVGDDGTAEVWVSAEADAQSSTGTVEGEPGDKEHVRIVVVDGEGGEPKTYEWKTEDGKTVTFSGEGNVHFLEDLACRGYLGVQLVELTPELREHYGATAEHGVLVGKVEPGSPAEAAGLRVGDVIVALDGESIDGSWDVRHHVRALSWSN
jgi:membrane-associated protease RseP (regulator of RpoE activity)